MSHGSKRGPLDEKGHTIHEELTAILDEHLPAETVTTVLQKVDALSSNHFNIADYDQLLIYRALLGLIPEHAQEVRAAFQPVTFRGCRSDEVDWLRWERGINWAITPLVMQVIEESRESGDTTCS